ncbi:pimeloyl-[acyl-carrier protein] methyl ester esterase [Methylobacillus rhizosphaerae]|uniref:Pimeloyl-[acyl-carrier protein] methyl ester esterase n=1 Tax=Methylobacillus rhizosphaerae TaxID=551994 RepID=A0A238Y2R8_9PROT|nr:pimeloyl-ACP methyl ester esterase BioH [Methylobacillus rhizosphaerae]SNR65262.1 pimeloyl-[acyl-carrier protein] methyl ester esterase [Methylobacillus rhizosphaerae]
MSTIHQDIIGKGQPLVLIHGWGMHGGVWQPLVKKLSQSFELHIVDLPGMGLSHDMAAENLDDMVAALLPVLPQRANVLGWSLGGLVAQRLAMQHPALVEKLVLVGSTPRFVNTAPDDPQPWQYGMAAAVFQKFAQQVGADYAATLIKFLTLQCMGANDARSTIKQLRQALAGRPVPSPLALESALNVLLQNDLRSDLPGLQQPVLLIHGDRDTLAPVQAANWLVQHLPHARLRVISGAGHAPFLSHTAQFIESVRDFLESVTDISQ